jgi:Domain of Unknown Function (DUF1206)
VPSSSPGEVARNLADSPLMTGIARFGLASRGFVYLVLGWLAIQIARRHAHHEANARGALAEIARESYGRALLWVLALGLAAYALWRLSEAILGTTTDGKKPGPRIASLVGGIIYLAFCVATLSFIAGDSNHDGSQQQVTATARVMRHTGGRWLVGLIGVVVVIVGVVIAVQGARRTFKNDLRITQMSESVRAVVVSLAIVGTVARGVVFALTGVLVVEAALSFDPRKSTGLDGALRTLAEHSYGPWLLGAFAIGFIAFGLYGFAEARWSKT